MQILSNPPTMDPRRTTAHEESMESQEKITLWSSPSVEFRSHSSVFVTDFDKHRRWKWTAKRTIFYFHGPLNTCVDCSAAIQTKQMRKLAWKSRALLSGLWGSKRKDWNIEAKRSAFFAQVYGCTVWLVWSSIRQSTKTNALEAGYRSVTDNHPCHELAGMIPFHVVYLFESDWFWIH